MTLELTRRSPGRLPRLTWPLKEGDVIELNRWMKRMSEVTQGLPQHHAETHKQPADSTAAFADSVSGSGIPTEIDFDTEGSEGDAREGFAPFDHKHPASEGLAALEPLSNVTTETIEGKDVAYVYDPEGTELLSLIVLELAQLVNADISNG